MNSSISPHSFSLFLPPPQAFAICLTVTVVALDELFYLPPLILSLSPTPTGLRNLLGGDGDGGGVAGGVGRALLPARHVRHEGIQSLFASGRRRSHASPIHAVDG